jgi:copper chaperone CopZ
MKTTTFQIEGMRCDGCAQTIKMLVEKEPGVKGADVSLESSTARILYDPNATDDDRLAATIEKPGYHVVGRQ